MSGARTKAAKRPARTRRLDCPNCGGSVEVRASGISVSAICPSCGSTLDLASPELKVIAEARARTREPLIPIGTRATLVGTAWEVVGFQVRSEPEKGWTWDEYLLFNPYRGFRFLARDDEGWTLFATLRQDVPDPERLEGDRRRYTGLERSQARTDYVLGEFYWRVRAGDVSQVAQYEANGYVLVEERTGDEIVWSRGAKLPSKIVEAAFGLPSQPETNWGVLERRHTVRVLQIAAAGLVLLVLLHAMSFGASRSLLIFKHAYSVTAADRGRSIVSEAVTVPDASGNLRIDMTARVQNDWLDLAFSLVREPGGDSFNATGTVEYYTGSDEDGSWVEGSQQSSVLFRHVPGGTYRLVIDADGGTLRKTAPPPADASRSQPSMNARRTFDASSPAPAARPKVAGPLPAVPFTVEIRRHVPAPEFFWIALALLLPYPAYRLLFRRGDVLVTGPRLFAAYCAIVLFGFSVAKYQGWALGSQAQPASSSSSGGTRGGGGSSGSHK